MPWLGPEVSGKGYRGNLPAGTVQQAMAELAERANDKCCLGAAESRHMLAALHHPVEVPRIKQSWCTHRRSMEEHEPESMGECRRW